MAVSDPMGTMAVYKSGLPLTGLVRPQPPPPPPPPPPPLPAAAAARALCRPAVPPRARPGCRCSSPALSLMHAPRPGPASSLRSGLWVTCARGGLVAMGQVQLGGNGAAPSAGYEVPPPPQRAA